jgi:dipeptidyl aminopeptidase/acylaminoacyl peptidase
MNEERLKTLLRETPVPGEAEAAQRGLRVVSEAFAEREPPRRPVLPRLAGAFAIVTLLAALMLSPAGAEVRDWIDDVFTAGVRNAEPALTELPGGGRLLVHSADGAWVVHGDGSRRLLGRFAEATWSPHGLFVAVVSGRTLSAVDPEGNPRWSISARTLVSDPRWSPSGVRIAYRAGRELRVVVANGTDDTALDPLVAPLAPAWSPQGAHMLAYVDSDGELRLLNTDTRQTLGSSPALPGIEALAWSPDGSTLLEASPRSLRLREVTVSKLGDRLELGPPRRVDLPAGATVRTAAFAPDSQTVAALLRLPASGPRSIRSEVISIGVTDGTQRRLFGVSGGLSDLAWSPQGRRLLLTWPLADQWLFIPVGGRGIRAIDRISEVFGPGERSPSFPRIEGWCCQR